jgi:putative oxidoreductase
VAIAFLIVRLLVGLGILAHGSQKLFGSFGGPGLKGMGDGMTAMGYRPGVLFALLAGLGEFVAGLLIVFGFLGPIGPALLILVMVTAIGTVHVKNGYWVANNGYEFNTIYIAAALLLAFVGFGDWSLDHAWGTAVFSAPGQTWIVVGIGVVLALLSLASRRPAPSA